MVKLGVLHLNLANYYYNFENNTICLMRDPKYISEYESLDELLTLGLDDVMIARIDLIKRMINA